MGRRQPNRRPTIYPGSDGLYHCWVSVGRKPDGRLDRRHIKRKTASQVVDAVDDLLRRTRQAGGVAPTKVETVEQWLAHWLEHIVRPRRRRKTYEAYRPIVHLHLIPNIGRWRLDGTRNRLEPEHLDEMYAKLRRGKQRGGAGLSASYIRQIHAVLRVSLKTAVRRGKAARNVCDLVDPPASGGRHIASYAIGDAQAILRAALDDPLAARWLVGLLLGPRQGETLGLRWPDVDLASDEPGFWLRKQLQRQAWRHGCENPVACAAPHCRTKPCGPSWEHGCQDSADCKGNPRWCPARRQRSCRIHTATRGCPPLCRPGCTRHALHCPDRFDGGLVEVELKSEKSKRRVPLEALVAEALRRWREEQMRAFDARGARWDDRGLVFTTPSGKPIDPRRDHEAWEQLLVRAGVPDGRLHAARHTAASLLIATGTRIEVVQELLGHTDIRVTRGYVDVAEQLKREAVTRIADALFAGDLAKLLQPNRATDRT